MGRNEAGALEALMWYETETTANAVFIPYYVYISLVELAKKSFILSEYNFKAVS